MAEHRAIITGGGLVTALGSDLARTWSALLAGGYITTHARLSVAPSVPEMSRAAQFGLDAARQAIDQARWTPQILSDPATALIVGTSKGSVENWMTPLSHIDVYPYVAAGRVHPEGLADIASAIAQSLGLTGPRLTVSAACASGLHALARAALMIATEQARRVLVVATEASVHPLFLASFRRLGVLAPESAGCRPFDRARRGFLMSEAAAAVCVESAEHRTGSTAAVDDHLIAIDRYACAADATHLTGADPRARALRHVIARALDGRIVDLVHAHGTATLLHDPIELAAIEDALPTRTALSNAPSPPALYSHKAALGHSLGAAGLVSIVLNRHAHRTGIVPPNIRSTDPLPMRTLTFGGCAAQGRPVRRSLVIASGFGGAIAAMTLLNIRL